MRYFFTILLNDADDNSAIKEYSPNPIHNDGVDILPSGQDGVRDAAQDCWH